MNQPKPDAGRSGSPPSVADRTEKLVETLNSCRPISSVDDVISLLDRITAQVAELLQADRVTIFFLDWEKCELWSVIRHENQKRIIRFDARLGIAGATAMSGQIINAPDAYQHPLFFQEVDKKTGYRTRTLLAVPLRNADGNIIGVGEALNKRDGPFTEDDAEVLRSLATHLFDTIETTQLDKLLPDQQWQEKKASEKEIGGGYSTRNIIGISHRIQAIIRLIDQIRHSSVDVLIEGESGTGKELVARALHYNGPRLQGLCLALNCAALPENLLESELFGIEKGVATGVDRRIGKFEQASGGTLFLDEIGNMSLTAQAKILRALQERTIDRVGGKKTVPIDVRIISATNKNLETAIKEGLFREDLYYRLRVIHIQMPSLREIPEDIPVLANHFFTKYCQAMGTEPKHLTPAALEAITHYSWPGNTRQLENEIKRLVASVRGAIITEDDLDPAIRACSAEQAESPETPTSRKQLVPALEALERRMIQDALREAGGNKQKAAHALGLSRQGLIKKLKRMEFKA